MHSFLRLTRTTCVTVALLLLPSMANAAENQDLLQQDASLHRLSLAQAIANMQLNNPALLAKHQRALAWAEKPAQVGSLPDPVLSVAAISLPADSFSRSQEAMTQMQLGITQALPFPGKLALKSQAERLLAQVAAEDVQALRLQLISQVKSSWWNLAYLNKALATVGRNQVLLRQFIRIAETKYKVGKGLQQDVLLAQLELSKLLDVAIRLQAAHIQEQARLNALMFEPFDNIITLPKNMDESLLVSEDAKALNAYALQHRPVFKQQHTLIEVAQTRIDLADKDYYPDFSIAAKYGARADNSAGVARADLLSLSLNMTLPFFTSGKQDAQLQQRQAGLAQAEFMLQDVKSKVFADIRIHLAAYEQAKEQSVLFKQGIIPQATQTVASMLAAYQVNKVDFLNLVRAQVTLYNYETQYWKVLAQAKQSLARLDAAIGKELP